MYIDNKLCNTVLPYFICIYVMYLFQWFSSLRQPQCLNRTLDADSGCPGSDRSTLWFSYLQSKRISPSTRSNSKSKENIHNSLYNLEEETICSPIRTKSEHPVTPREIVNMNTDFVQSITIESNDLLRDLVPLEPENPLQVNNEERGDSYSSAEEVIEGHNNNFPATPAKSATKLKTCKNLFPGVESHDLAAQIDNEILELRNFFDDHREEMMFLLHGNKDEIDSAHNTSLPAFKQNASRSLEETKNSKSLMNIRTRDFRYSDGVEQSQCSTPGQRWK